MTQLRDLAEPFPAKLVQPAPQGKYGDYVAHSSVTERALSIVGPYSQHVAQIIYDGDQITGCVLRIEVEIDGRRVFIEEAGDVENPSQKKTNGARLKDAVSDAVKRCWMREGLGLHLWSQADYFLNKQLDKNAGQVPGQETMTYGPDDPERPYE